MGDADAQAGPVDGAALERRCEFEKRLAIPADALDRQHLAVLDREDRLDVQQLAGQGAGLTDAPAACEVLERVDGEQQPRLAAVALDQRVDLLVARATLEPA